MADIPKDNDLTPANFGWLPNKLIAKDGYQEGLDFRRTFFKMREYDLSGKTYQIVTIEDLPVNEAIDSQRLSIVSPFNLVGTENFRSEINDQTKFYWRYVKFCNKNYRAVTLEN